MGGSKDVATIELIVVQQNVGDIVMAAVSVLVGILIGIGPITYLRTRMADTNHSGSNAWTWQSMGSGTHTRLDERFDDDAQL